MGKKRVVDSKIRASQSFKNLTYRQRDLWHGLIVTADDQGRLPGNPDLVKSWVWPYDRIDVDEVVSDLNTLVNSGNIVCYQVKGEAYIQIVNWWKYQQGQWASPSDYPAPKGWVDRARYHTTGNKILAPNWNEPGGFPDGFTFTTQYSLLNSQLNSMQDSQPDSLLTTTREEVKDDVKGDGEDEIENNDGIPVFRQLSTTFVNNACIPELTGGAPKWNAAIEKMVKAGITPDDLSQAIQEMNDKGLSYTGPWSCINPAIMVMSRRLSQEKHFEDSGDVLIGPNGETMHI